MCKPILLLFAAITLTACASRPQYVAAPCPSLPVPPAVLRQPLPTLDLLPPGPESGSRATTNSPPDAQKRP